jgi:carboxylesterase
MEMNHTTWRDWLSAAENTLLELMDTYDKVFILGESMGGLLTLYLAAHYPSLLGAMVFAPAIKIRNLWLTKFIWRFKPLIKKGKPNPQIPQQSYASFPLRAAASLLDLQRIVKNHLKKIKIPVIIFQGKLDDTIDPMGALYAYEHIRHEDKDFVYLEESSHIILLDKQLPVVQQICHDFILARLP